MEKYRVVQSINFKDLWNQLQGARYVSGITVLMLNDKVGVTVLMLVAWYKVGRFQNCRQG